MIKTVKLSKFNGELCENLYTDVRFITPTSFDDITNLYNRVNSSMDNKNWLKFRDFTYLMNVLDEGGFIIGCYVDETLVASAICEPPNGDYLNNLYEIGLSERDIASTYVSGYVMVDPLYRGNSLHKILLETRMEEAALRGKQYILTAIAEENVYSLKTVLNLGFEIKLQKRNENGVTRNLLFKQLSNLLSENIEFTA
ncbi:GNAT family N-acetyltransferase [Romboutsia sp.]|uniref:GNAT family N-acetyltransferase n=1 Tax=Romboutsia sp. TaxID=1965302 RepID=UPI003F2C4375